MQNETLVITGAANIEAYRMLAIKSALKLESIGLRRNGPSALSMVNKMGIKARTAKQALPLYVAKLQKMGIMV